MTEENSIVRKMIDQPLCDPAWEYLGVYVACHSAREAINQLIVFVGEIENPTADTDRSIATYLEQISALLKEAQEIVKN